jgi:hypothetical protein
VEGAGPPRPGSCLGDRGLWQCYGMCAQAGLVLLSAHWNKGLVPPAEPCCAHSRDGAVGVGVAGL